MTNQAVPRRIQRREFLRMSAAAAAGIAASGVISPATLFASTAKDTLPLLSIGFAAGLPHEGEERALGHASSMFLSDPRFRMTGAKVTVAGFGQPSRSDIREGGIALNAVYPSGTGARFVAWTLNVRDGVRAESSGVGFTMPVKNNEGLRFLVHRTGTAKLEDPTKPAPPDAAQQNEIALALGFSRGPKLRRGVYVLAFRETSRDVTPSWSRLTVRNEGGRLTVNGLDTSYVVLSVDHA